MLNVICVRHGSAYGVEYVNRLHSMVKRHLTVPFRFIALTDDRHGLDDGIDFIRLPSTLEKWWGKLWMFKRGLFPDGSRCLFFDLDTVIVDNIDDIAGYNGQIATLRDFYYPNRLGPAIVAWRAGDLAAWIWDEWDCQGQPRDRMGDLWWLNNLDQGRFAKSVDILQNLYPDQIYSYKAHGLGKCYPDGASIVCFHGEPKPHNCGSAWVAEHWR